MAYKSKRSKACDISQKVKKRVYERDNGLCIFCGSSGMPNAHVIARSHGGLGIEENIVTACIHCHHRMDNSLMRDEYVSKAKKYLQSIYPDWDEKKLIYNKWDFSV